MTTILIVILLPYNKNITTATTITTTTTIQLTTNN